MSGNRWPKGRKIAGSGRKKGTRNKTKPRDRLLDRAKKVANRLLLPDVGTAPDTDPLDFLLAVMRRPDLPLEVRLHAARCAAPYKHPALKSVDFTGQMLFGISGELQKFIAGNATARRSFLGFDGEDQDPQAETDERALPHH